MTDTAPTVASVVIEQTIARDALNGPRIWEPQETATHAVKWDNGTWSPASEWDAKVHARGHGSDYAARVVEPGDMSADLVRFEPVGHANVCRVRLDYADAPTPGADMHGRHLEPSRWWLGLEPAEGEVWIQEVPIAHSNTPWGPPDHVAESNFHRLVEDYAEHLVTVTYSDSDSLGVIVGSTVSSLLAEAVHGLAEYPLYDEEDHSRRELEDLWETVREAEKSAWWHLSDEAEAALETLQYDEDARTALGTEVANDYLETGTVWRGEDVRDSDIQEALEARLLDLAAKRAGGVSLAKM